MAKGGSMKGHMQSHNNGGRGRTYALLVLLAFGAAIFGATILHKLRERRILVKDKESELTDLKLLLQKEKHAKEAKKQVEDMKSKIQRLRTQKRDLESRISEMKSTISSLKDEQRIIEVALEEKQDEIKMLREKHVESNPENSQVKFLFESLRQKEAELEDLKHHPESPVKVWSVSADDPSNPPINFTINAAGRDEASGGESKELPESVKRDDQKNSTGNVDSSADESALNRNEATRQGKDRGQAQDGERSAGRKGNSGEQLSHELTTAQEDVQDNKSTTFQTLEGQRETANRSKAFPEKKYNSEHASMEIINHSGQVQEQSNEVSVVDATDSKEHGRTIEGELGNSANSQGNDQGSGQNYIGALKLEMNDDPKSRDATRVNQENKRNTKGKSRRIIAESKVTESGGDSQKSSIASMRNRKFFKEMQERATTERVGGSKQEKQEHQEDKNMDQVRQKKSSPEGIDMTNKTQQFKDLEAKFGNQIRPEQEKKQDRAVQRKQDNSSNIDEAPHRKALPNQEISANAEKDSKEGRKLDRNQIIEKGQEREVKNMESEMSQSSQEKPAKTAVSKVNRVSKEARNKKPDESAPSEEPTGSNREHQEQKQADNLYNSSEHAKVAGIDEKADALQVEKDQETEGEENNTVVRDTEQRLAGNLDSSSAHAKNAEMVVEDDILDLENDEDTEAAGHYKGYASIFQEEGEDEDQTDESEF